MGTANYVQLCKTQYSCRRAKGIFFFFLGQGISNIYTVINGPHQTGSIKQQLDGHVVSSQAMKESIQVSSPHELGVRI